MKITVITFGGTGYLRRNIYIHDLKKDKLYQCDTNLKLQRWLCSCTIANDRTVHIIGGYDGKYNKKLQPYFQIIYIYINSVAPTV